MFVWGRWRHDMVALGSLLACVLTGLLPPAEAFAGFGHPAVITVACVLILSGALQSSGAVDALAQRVLPTSAGPTLTIAALTGLGAILSAFMNNVGAMALLMPVATRVAAKQNLPPGKVLMPLAFGTILGGMTTLIGTPPNLIVSGFRAETGTGGFGMFDFTPVGLAVAAGGVLFVALIGWRLVPAREQAGAEGFDIGAYLTEARVTEGSKALGKTVREIEQMLDETDAQVVGVIHNEIRVARPDPGQVLQAGDVLVIEAEPESLASVLSSLGLNLEEDSHKQPESPDVAESQPDKGGTNDENEKTENAAGEEIQAAADEIALIELVVRPDAALISRSATDIHLRNRYGINFLAFSRHGRRSVRRLRSELFRAGDVLLMQGAPEAVLGFASEFGCVPLEQRSIRIPDKRRAIAATAIMAAAIAGAAFGLLPAAISFAAGVLAATAFRVIPLRTVYDAIDWPVIVLLAALFPIASVMASTGAADQVARLLLENVAQGHAILGLTVILVLTMTLSDFMNNAATAAVMCPIAISTATQLGAKTDPFLMAVAIGASCAFLTPIGHQNNTLIMGPAGLRFGDYWKLGLPLEILVVVIGVPTILLVWPL
ncbi:MAG: di/tricarboxylate transporter [Verrucomicrobiales bacterium]|jgi:di/tricarboxylate transporter